MAQYLLAHSIVNVTKRRAGTKMRIGKISAVGALVVLGVSAGPVSNARAGYIVTLEQVGSDVVATGSGSIDLTGLTYVITDLNSSLLHPSLAIIAVGPTASTLTDAYDVAIGPGSFGPGGFSAPTSGSGPLVELSGASGYVFVPAGYVADTSLGTSIDTWDNATFASLGLTPGSYTWSWDGGAGSFTVDVIPEPASITLMVTGLVGLGLKRRRRRTTN
jgi:hypothetical protein